jgi:3-oxoacyl-[acyl-carrier protein] reductase
MRIDLSGRIAIITGASRLVGIGAATAHALAAAGANVFLTYYLPYDQSMPWGSQPHDVERQLANLRALGVRAYSMEANLAEPQAADRILEAVTRLLGLPSILVNNATNSEPGDIMAMDAGQLDRHYAVNVRGMAMLCKAFLASWQGTTGGRIINMTSGQGVGPMSDELAYATTKGAVEAFTVSLAPTAARRGVTVNAVDPGITDTGWINDELYRQFTAAAPFGRVGLPTDAANLITFLASDQGGWITGQILHARGGL